MSNLTYKIRHGLNLTHELELGRKVAEFAIQNKGNTNTKFVKHIGLKSQIACQVMRKYGGRRTKQATTKAIRNIVLPVPNQGIKWDGHILKVPVLKWEIMFEKEIVKICQIEFNKEYAFICCEVKDEKQYETEKYIGIDRNATRHIAVCATTDGKVMKLGKKAPHIHRKYKQTRKALQKQKKFRKIKSIKNRESRITRDINHKISRAIVTLAKEGKYAIKLEKLTGIRKKKQGRSLNGIKSNWSFYQLEQFIGYKAKLLGVPVHYVASEYTSQTCARCGRLGTRDKKSFSCICGNVEHADVNAAFNIAKASILRKGEKRLFNNRKNEISVSGALIPTKEATE
jgi:putative transposase